MRIWREITGYLSENLRKTLRGLSDNDFKRMEEIRLRIGKPVMLSVGGRELFPDAEGFLSDKPDSGYRPVIDDIDKTLALVSDFSLYALGEELKSGYITLPEGHRVGVTGRAVTENGRIKYIRNVSGLNIRVSHEIRGCASKIMGFVTGGGIRHTMIVSPPGCGKTTLLRDIVRTLSTGIEGAPYGVDVGVVDERSEIAGCRNGIAQNDIGPRTDVLDACPKPEGMLLLLRSMSPKVIAVDEIGSDADVEAICNIMNAGVKVLCTVHSRDTDELCRKPALSRLMGAKAFERLIILKNRGEVAGVYDSEMRRIDPGAGSG